MKMPKIKDLLEGKVLETDEAKDLREQWEQDLEKRKEIWKTINAHEEPISITIHQKTGNFTFHNMYFWQMLWEQKEDQLFDYMAHTIGTKT